MVVRTVILVAEGYTDSSLSVALDVLRTANALAGPTFDIALASAHGGFVRAASGLAQVTTKTTRLVAGADVVVVPGFWVADSRGADVLLARADIGALVRALGRADARGAVLGAACSAVFLLAAAGTLGGKRATTTWWLAPHLQRRYPTVRVDASASLVAHERVLCAGAVFAIADLALHLVARFSGPKVARRCSKLLLLAEHPSQAPYMAVHHLASNDSVVRRAEAWVRAHLAEPFAIANLAAAVGTSPRTLARKLRQAVGLSPIAFVRQIRTETAVHLLRTTGQTADEISRHVGYRDASTLRKLLQRRAAGSPRQLRGR